MKDIPWLPGYQQSRNTLSVSVYTVNIQDGKGLNNRRRGGNSSKEGVSLEFKGLRSKHDQADNKLNNNGNNSTCSINKECSGSSSSSENKVMKRNFDPKSTIFPPSESKIGTHSVRPESGQRESTEIFLKFYLWLFENFINPLISSSFYVTEAEGRGTEVHYYRKGVWNRILKKAKQQMGDHFMKIVKSHNLPPSSSHPRAGALSNREWLQQDDKNTKKKQHVFFSQSQMNRNRDFLSITAVHTDSNHLSGDDNINDYDKYSNKAANHFAADILSQPAINNNNINNCNNINSSCKNSQKKLDTLLHLETAPAVRFVPKKLSVRPITNLKSRPKAKNIKDKNR